MILLDTNVLSEVMQNAPHRRVIDWLDRQPRISVWTTSITVLDIRFGLGILPEGKRRVLLTKAFDRLLSDLLQQRIASFDAAAAEQSANLMAIRQRTGSPGDLRDVMIAGIALSTNAAIATRNVKHFQDLPCPLVNPWSD